MAPGNAMTGQASAARRGGVGHRDVALQPERAEVIHNLKEKVVEIRPALPEGGVTIEAVHDAQTTIHRAIGTLTAHAGSSEPDRRARRPFS